MSEVWVKCEICGKGFDSYEALIAHIYSHIADLKQKLQQWMKEYEEICQDSETDYVRRCLFLEEKFEELLKEVDSNGT